jgi:predicted TIM-barrel fold metal-dependent hydrolase
MGSVVPYVEGRTVHDADSHVFEPAGAAEAYIPAALRARVEAAIRYSVSAAETAAALARADDPEFRAHAADEILVRKNAAALGAVRAADRPEALDLLGFASQLVFTTSYLAPLRDFDRGADPDLAYGLAAGHNRYITDFCAVDRRLLPVCFVPLCDLERAAACGLEAIEMGAGALMICSDPPRGRSPSHIGLDPLWAAAAEARVPVVFHVGGEQPVDPAYLRNGLPPVPDFHGGDDNFTSVSYMAIPYAPMQAVATMIFDGVLDRFEDLRIGLIELGASWVSGWMRSMDSAAGAFRRNEERLQRLTLTPSEFVRRQVRVTPYPHEPAGWIARTSGPEVTMFSSDYPHVEGGRNPMKRFETSLNDAGATPEERDGFFRDNFADLVGPTAVAAAVGA